MEEVFQALIDRSRVLLDLKTIKTILGYKHRPKYRKRKGRSAAWEVTVERPTYDLTIFKLHCGRLTLKIYTQGERVLRIEAVAHDTAELDCGRALENFPRIVSEWRGILERFIEALSCIDQCFISDETLEQLPAPSQVGKTKVGGIDFNKARIRHVTEAVISLSASPGGFTASQLAARVRDCGDSDYQSRQAAYDLKKLRGKDMVRRVGKTRHYEPTSSGLRALAALLVLRDKVIKPLLAASMETRPTHGAQNPRTLDNHYEAIRVAMQGRLSGTGLGRVTIDNFFVGLRPQVPNSGGGRLLAITAQPSSYPDHS